MRTKRYAAKVDLNQAGLVADLRSIGADVVVIGRPVDLLVGFRGKNYLFEIKQPSLKALRPDQRPQYEWLQAWKGQAAVIRTSADAYRVLGVEFVDALRA